MAVSRKQMLHAVVCAAALLTSGALLRAQSIAGEIDGTVTDTSGATIPNADVTITNLGTNKIARATKTNGRGQYRAPLLPIGRYKIAVMATGFEKTQIVGIQLNVSDTLTMNAQLHAGGVDVQVTVTASALEPNISTSENSGLTTQTQIRELALNTRNFEQMVLLQPGVTNQGPDESVPGLINGTGAANVHNISLNGLRQNQVSWTIDGGDILNPVGLQQVAVFPSIDSIAQIKTLRNSYGAQYGGGGSGQVTVASQGGGSTFHGDAFEFFRAQYLDANDFQNLLATPQKPRADENYNDFGYTIGGPVILPGRLSRLRNDTYFFVSQEFRRIKQSNPISMTNFPSAPQTMGYFAHQVCIQYQLPTNATCVKQSPLVTNSPFPGFNYQVPTIDPVSQLYLKDVIDPAVALQPVNSPVDVQGILFSGESNTHENQISARVDHSFGSRLSMFARYLYDPYSLDVPYGLYATAAYPGVSNAQVKTFGKHLSLHGTSAITASTVADFGYSYVDFGVDGVPTGFLASSHSPDINLTLPYPVTLSRIPSLTINGGGWSTQGPRHTRGHIQQGFENTTKQLGQHTLYFGVNFEHTAVSDNAALPNGGSFNFSGVKAGSNTVFEQAFTNFLIGRVNNFTQASIDALSDIENNIFELYLQDDWRATPRLTLNAGVRYSLFGQPYDGENHLGGLNPYFFNPANAPTFGTDGSLCITGVPNPNCTVAPNPNYNRLNGIILGGVNSPFGRALESQPLLNFAPRVGFAWDVTGHGTTSLRAGFGIFYNRTPASLATNELNGNPAYVVNSTFNTVTFEQPGGTGAVATAVPSITGQDPNWVTPYTEDYSIGIQQRLMPSWILDIGYVGNATFHLSGEEDLNQLAPGFAASTGGSLSTFRPTSAANEAAINYLRPFPGFGPIAYYSPRFFADYHSLQVSTTRNFGLRNLINANYTWSKAMANSLNTSGNAPQNRFDLRPEWSPTAADRRNVFVADVVYELPFFLGEHGFKSKVLGGFVVSAIVQAVSGLPVDISGTSLDSGGQGNLAAGSDAEVRPDQTGNPNGPKTIASFFNTSAFTLVPVGQFRQGNAHHNSVEGPGYQTWNITATRNFSLPREMRLQVRLETFNAFNHVNYNSVSGAVNNTTAFGTVTGYREMRKLQLAGKFYF